MSGARGNPAIPDDEEDDIPLVSAGGRQSAQGDQGGDSGDIEIVDVPDDYEPNAASSETDTYVERQQKEDSGETAEQRQAREDRLPRNQRRKHARDRMFGENQQLRTRLAELEELVKDRIEPRLNTYDETHARQSAEALDRQIAEAQGRVNSSRRALTEAMISQDADALTAALEERDAAFVDQQRLQARKQIIEQTGRDPLGEREQQGGRQQTQRTQETPAQAPLPRAAKELLDDFTSRHDWIDAKRDRSGAYSDVDTAILMRLDQAVAAEGFNPSSPDYWDELEARAKKYLPHKFSEERQEPRQRAAAGGSVNQRPAASERRGPMVGAGNNGTARQPASNQVHLTPGRKTALIQAGVLEPDGRTVTNRDKFMSYVKKYQEYDRASGSARQ